MNQGIIFAILTIFLYGSWAVPTKTLKIDPKVMAFFLTLGHLIIGIIIFSTSGRQVSSIQNLVWPFVAGLLWATGITLGYIAIKNLGITRAIGIWVPVNILIGALWGLIFFGEAKLLGTQKLMISLFGIGLLIAAGLTVISSIKTQKVIGNVKQGVLTALGIGLLHGSVFVPLNASNLPFFVTFLPFCLGMVVLTALIMAINKLNLKYDRFTVFRMMSGGLILGSGNYLALLTIKHLGYANGFALTQLSIVVNTLWGALVFKEVTSTKGKILIAIGVAIALAGAFILNSARL